ncbi:MAG: HAD family phosphatase [Prevotella sp.]|jgi:HAD superfamily hydrolase (TIGR01509 family)|nr:HAD family phosphatase [Prevotella sp.]
MKKSTNISTVLFGLDGVIVDTGKAYDSFWTKVAEDNNLTIKNFSSIVKGMTFNSIIELYFPLLPIEEKQAIRKAVQDMNQSLDYKEILIPGVLDFINYLRNKEYKIGVVTSSPSYKVKIVLEQLSLSDSFDTIITSDSIKKGKPDPMGYVLAKTNLGVQSSECVVFEDSFTGIKAATYAFMRVIGVGTDLSEDYLKDYTFGVTKDFSDLEKVKSFLN